MKITDLPKKSEARRLLTMMDRGNPAYRERLRCAQHALDLALWCHEKYHDEPAQWIRCEQLLQSILKDNCARFEWFRAERKARRGGKA